MINQIKSRYIIPFGFGKAEQSKRNYLLFLDRKTDPYNGSWKESSVKNGEQDLYEYVLNSFDDAGVYMPGNIGASYEYVPCEEGKVLSLDYHLFLDGNSRSFSLSIDKAGMFLFVSGTGFFWFEFGRPVSEDGGFLAEKEYILFNNRFKELNYRSNLKSISLHGSEEPFSVGNWAAQVVEAACGKVSFFSRRKNILTGEMFPEYVPDKALIFNYAVSDENTSKENLVEQAYYLTKGYNWNYRMPSDAGSEMKQPFENVIWYAANEGAGYYAISDSSNRQFFTELMNRRFLNDYFLAYILSLNVEYSVIHYSGQISTLLPADPYNYLSSDLFLEISDIDSNDVWKMLELEKAIRRMITEINVFVIKNVRSSISYIGHQNDFFRYVSDMLAIKEKTEWLLTGLSSLQKLLSDAARMEKELKGDEIYGWRKDQEYQKLREEKQILQKELFTDPMTGLYNRKGMNYYTRQMISESKRERKALFVCMVDMNGLKYINDNFGHEHGDRAIKELSRILEEVLTEKDKAFRLGGDEFLIAGIHEVGEEVRKDFTARMEDAINRSNDNLQLPYRVDASFGPMVQPMEDYDEGIDELIKLSDKLMYDMKKKRDPHMRGRVEDAH